MFHRWKMVLASVSFLLLWNSAALAQETTLKVLFGYAVESERQITMEALREFERQNPEIHLNIQAVEITKIDEILQVRLAAGDYPDVVNTNPTRIQHYASLGILADLSEYADPAILAEFDPSRLLEVRFGEALVGLPARTSVRGLAYNKDYLDQIGVRAPATPETAWTWEAFEDVARKIQANTRALYGLQFAKPSSDAWIPTLYQAGGALLEDDLRTPAITQPKAVKAIEWTVGLHRSGLAAPGILEGTEDPLTLFATGLVGLWNGVGTYMTPAMDASIRTFDYAFTFLPMDEAQVTMVGGDNWVALDTGNAEASWALIEFMTRPENLARNSGLTNNIPARDVGDYEWNWAVADEFRPYFVVQARFASSAAVQHTLQPVYAATRSRLLQELGRATSLQISAREAAAAMAKHIEEYFRD